MRHREPVHPSPFNQALAAHLEARIEKRFSLVRYSVVAEAGDGAFLLARGSDANFPTLTFGDAWQLFSSTYFACDMFDADLLEDTRRVLTEDGLEVEALILFAAVPFQKQILWADRWVNSESHYVDASLLNLYFYARCQKQENLCPGGDDYLEFAWLGRQEALQRIEVAPDREILARLEYPVRGLLERA
jgi:hypothetical protein